MLDGKKAWHPPLGHREQGKVKLDRLEFLCDRIYYILLSSSMTDFELCDQLMQKAHCSHAFSRASQRLLASVSSSDCFIMLITFLDFFQNVVVQVTLGQKNITRFESTRSTFYEYAMEDVRTINMVPVSIDT